MNQSKKLAIAGLLLLFATAKIAMLLWWQQQQPNTPANTVQAVCNITDHAGCPFANDATLRLIGVRGNKTPFSIEIRGVPDSTNHITASFSMRDMDMGFNRFTLQKQPDGTWRIDSVYLPFCVAGRHDWLITWRVDDATFSAPFKTTAE